MIRMKFPKIKNIENAHELKIKQLEFAHELKMKEQTPQFADIVNESENKN